MVLHAMLGCRMPGRANRDVRTNYVYLISYSCLVILKRIDLKITYYAIYANVYSLLYGN